MDEKTLPEGRHAAGRAVAPGGDEPVPSRSPSSLDALACYGATGAEMLKKSHTNVWLRLLFHVSLHRWKGPFVHDFLPPPKDLVFKQEGVKVTIALSKRSVDFFKGEARKHRTPYQRMIRRLLRPAWKSQRRRPASCASRYGWRRSPSSTRSCSRLISWTNCGQSRPSRCWRSIRRCPYCGPEPRS